MHAVDHASAEGSVDMADAEVGVLGSVRFFV